MTTIHLGEIPVCSEATILPLNADATGLWALATSFNSVYKYKQFNATSASPIAVPVALNEDYTYSIKLYKPDGSLFNNAVYTIKTVPMLPDVEYTCIAAGETNLITVKSGKKQYVAGDDQAVFTNAVFEQAQVMLFIEGALRQEGEGEDEYSFDAVTGTVTLNAAAVAGQKITILYFKNI